MSLFSGFNQVQLLTMEPRLMCAVLAEELARTNQAYEALAEEIKQLKNETKKKEG